VMFSLKDISEGHFVKPPFMQRVLWDTKQRHCCRVETESVRDGNGGTCFYWNFCIVCRMSDALILCIFLSKSSAPCLIISSYH